MTARALLYAAFAVASFQLCSATELDKRDAERGRVQLAGETWYDVLQTLADVAGYTLECAELPTGELKLPKRDPLSIADARDLVNRMLFARGYTVLVRRNSRTFSVRKLSELNSAQVPRVAPEELDQRDPHEIVKVSFPLGERLDPEMIVEDLAYMKGTAGTVRALNATKHLQVVDMVQNLRQIQSVIRQEREEAARKQHVRVFHIQHGNSVEVEKCVREFLGMKSLERTSQPIQEPARQRRIEQMRAIAQRRQRRQHRRGSPERQKVKVPQEQVRLVVDRRQNTILACAPREKMVLIERVIQALDVGSPSGDDPLVWHSYKLAAVDAQRLVPLLKEVGSWDHRTRIEIDAASNAIVANATIEDHSKIDSVVRKLDGSGRNFYVVRLRRIRVEQVAGTIHHMMGANQPPRAANRRSYGYAPAQRGSTHEENQLYVDADAERNLLVVRATPAEYEEIENLLTRLGESGTGQTVRHIDVGSDQTAVKVLERIGRIWPTVSPNPLIIDWESEPKNPRREQDQAGVNTNDTLSLGNLEPPPT